MMTTDELLAQCESALRHGESILLSTFKGTSRPERLWCARGLGGHNWSVWGTADFTGPTPQSALLKLHAWLMARDA
jgi:hypothetical protein